MGNSDSPTIVIVGPTGSGKTGIAIELAEELLGEIVSADSRAIYKGMDIGTAKPTREERERVRHYGIDLVEPDERFTAVDFKKYATAKIADIRGRGKVPFLVGGTGLYVDSVIYDYSFSGVAKKTCSDRQEMGSDFLVVGILWGRDELRKRIEERTNKLFEQNIVGETERLAGKYGFELQAMKSNVYSIVWRMIQGEIDEAEAKRLNIREDMDLAKRQMTWFKRNTNIRWLPIEDMKEFIKRIV